MKQFGSIEIKSLNSLEEMLKPSGSILAMFLGMGELEKDTT
jgi:hypothetical protein